MKILTAFLLFLSIPAGAKNADDFQALIISADNSYLASEKDLEFASLDAKRLSQALLSAARVPASKIMNLKNPSLADLDRAIVGLAQNSTQKFMLYFSGHSDENGLHLKDGALTKARFHDILSRISAKVKIVILDSCFSGALKSKGVRKEKPIELVNYNVDEPTGSVILTSSSEREFSYESDKLKGSIFTYHLVSGLYGQADANADGLVTIDELYQYVYSQTKFQSMVSGGKVQSPEFESKLTGQGALVVSYPSRVNGNVRLAMATQGELTLSTTKGINFFKFYKNKGEDKTISVPRGKYDVTLVDDGRMGAGQIEVLEQETQELDPGNLVWQKRELPPVRAKGAQSKFLFGLAFSSHPAFYETEKDSTMGEFFLLSPSTEALWGRWRLAVHLGGEAHTLIGSEEKSEYSRLTIGGEGNYPGWNALGNEWLVSFRIGTFTAVTQRPNIPPNSSLSHLSLGSRFYPANWSMNWDLILGFDGVKAVGYKDRSVTTLGVALSF